MGQTRSCRAGIKPSTKIISVGGIPTAGKSLYEVADLLRGDEGTAVTLTVKGPGDKASKVLLLPRRRGWHPGSMALSGWLTGSPFWSLRSGFSCSDPSCPFRNLCVPP